MSPVWHRTCTEHRKQSILCLLSKHNQFTAKAVTTALLCSTKSHQISPVQCRTDTECMLQHQIHAKQMRFGAKVHHQTSPKYTEAHHQMSPKQAEVFLAYLGVLGVPWCPPNFTYSAPKKFCSVLNLIYLAPNNSNQVEQNFFSCFGVPSAPSQSYSANFGITFTYLMLKKFHSVPYPIYLVPNYITQVDKKQAEVFSVFSACFGMLGAKPKFFLPTLVSLGAKQHFLIYFSTVYTYILPWHDESVCKQYQSSQYALVYMLYTNLFLQKHFQLSKPAPNRPNLP